MLAGGTEDGPASAGWRSRTWLAAGRERTAAASFEGYVPCLPAARTASRCSGSSPTKLGDAHTPRRRTPSPEERARLRRIRRALERRPCRREQRRTDRGRGPSPRPLWRREGAPCGARLRRSDRAQPHAARARRYRALGALQARRRPRSPVDRRGAGHQSSPMGRDRGSGRGVLRRRGHAGDSANALRGRRREAVDLQLPGRRRPCAHRRPSQLPRPGRGRRAGVGVASPRGILPLHRRGARRRRCGVFPARGPRRRHRRGRADQTPGPPRGGCWPGRAVAARHAARSRSRRHRGRCRSSARRRTIRRHGWLRFSPQRSRRGRKDRRRQGATAGWKRAGARCGPAT